MNGVNSLLESILRFIHPEGEPSCPGKSVAETTASTRSASHFSSVDFEMTADLALTADVLTLPRAEPELSAVAREVRLVHELPWVRPLGRLDLTVTTEGWRFPSLPEQSTLKPKPTEQPPSEPESSETPADPEPVAKRWTRLHPPANLVLLKERLMYLLQPPLENLFANKLTLPFKPYAYQMEGIAFLMPRHAALLADEMGLGKTMQTILALKLLLHGGYIRKALIVAPKPLVLNWTRELHTWAEELPFEVITGDNEMRRVSWLVSNCPVKLINYELLTRDVNFVCDEQVTFDLVILDEAQRIKNKESKTSQVVCALKRERSWAMTGTPIENRSEDLVNIFSFVDPKCIPPDSTAKALPKLTAEHILRRTKEDVATDMPPKVIQDVYLELSPAQREAYDLAEKEGIVRLDSMGEAVSVQHVFELVMRLKQICNFEPCTGESTKLEQLVDELTEVAENGRKAIVFSQWVEPLEIIARAVKHLGVLQYHGRIPHKDRMPILDRFKSDDSMHVILMSYGTGSVGLNLQFTNHVFLYDRWWNPAIEDQAINRAHRLGQKSTVFVQRFISQNTIEERIAEVLDKKRVLFSEMIEQNGPPPQVGLTQEEIFGLFDIKARSTHAR